MKVVISSISFGNPWNDPTEKLREKGYHIITNNEHRKLSEEELINMMDKEVVGIVAGTEQITKKVMESAPNLKVISRFGIGIDNIDIDFAKKKGIVIHMTHSHVDAVAEHTLALILASYKNITSKEKFLGTLLRGKSIGIIGYGSVGKRLEELLKPFDMKIYIYDIKKEANTVFTPLDCLLKHSDIITIHCPLTESTTNLIGGGEIALMKNDVLLVNTARAGIIDEDALFGAMNHKPIHIALDVVQNRELFERCDKTIITQHTASYVNETRILMENEAINNLLEELQ